MVITAGMALESDAGEACRFWLGDTGNQIQRGDFLTLKLFDGK
jgi:hypothetical protein